MNSRDKIKIECAKMIAKALRDSGMDMRAFCEATGFQSSDVSRICNGRLGFIKIDRLVAMLESVGYFCEISIRERDGDTVDADIELKSGRPVGRVKTTPVHPSLFRRASTAN